MAMPALAHLLLSGDATLRELKRCGISPSGSMIDDGSWVLANELIRELPAWTKRAGLLASRSGDEFIVYLDPERALPSYFPATLTLDVGKGRYSVESRRCGRAEPVGLEVATAAPLVCGVPCSGTPMALLLRRIP
ncbi:MAG: hypothetical protein JXM71_02225 [Spirochaetales bacterium]|nr:hypothetical protein [Spirochaetales bacterium]